MDNRLISFVNLTPNLLSMAGADLPKNLQGKSLPVALKPHHESIFCSKASNRRGCGPTTRRS
jgi:hypothetical protein